MMTEKFKEYYIAHGCKVEQRANRQWYVLVPMRCPQLGEDNLCKIHDNKPKLCAEFDEKTKRGFYLTEGCMYK
jgi:Fe-S-cluster containining protein